MTQADVDVVRQAFDAFNSEDIERIVELTHPEFEAVVPPELSAEPDTYQGGVVFRTTRVGAFFYVTPEFRDRALAAMRENGFTPTE